MGIVPKAPMKTRILLAAALLTTATSCSQTPKTTTAQAAQPKDPSSVIGRVDEFGVTVIMDKPNHPACSRKFVSVKLDTFENCLVPGLTYVQVANILGYKGTLGAESGSSQVWDWNDGSGVLMAKFENGRLVSKSQSGLSPYQP
jgi:hypothetical protein